MYTGLENGSVSKIPNQLCSHIKEGDTYPLFKISEWATHPREEERIWIFGKACGEVPLTTTIVPKAARKSAAEDDVLNRFRFLLA